MRKTTPKYLVIRDSREQLGWIFTKGDYCAGTEVRTLKTGDYTLAGFEDKIVVERKRSTAEFANSVVLERFQRELDRLDEFECPYLVLEFGMEDIVKFPRGSGIPKQRWPELKLTPQGLMKKLHDIQMQHPKLRIVLAGQYSLYAVSSIFKRFIEHYVEGE